MNEERQILQDSVNRLFSDRLGWDQLTAIEESGFPADLWEEVSEQGITKVIASEAAGGMAGSRCLCRAACLRPPRRTAAGG